MNGLITSIVHRPYVFIFLAAYLFLAWRRWGWTRTIVWLISGYAIAWLSEFSSINNGFPYGEYHYIYENMPGELMIAGVPFFDSLSYPFLIFAGFTTAEFMLPRAKKIWLILAGSTLTMMLDVIIDPVAKLGKQWFLGEIYYYAHPGEYFGIPLTNFAGWFLVPFVVILFNMFIWRFLESRTTYHAPRTTVLNPLFYASIALFNIGISFWIGATILGLTSSVILTTMMMIVTRTRIYRIRRVLP